VHWHAPAQPNAGCSCPQQVNSKFDVDLLMCVHGALPLSVLKERSAAGSFDYTDSIVPTQGVHAALASLFFL